jgi:quaternary ammonium compound-resistance protein SugE
MAWLFLLIAGILEIGWPLGMKFSQTTSNKTAWIIFSVICMAGSGYFLYLAQKQISMGTAYAIWTGIGALGALSLGILLFKDPVSFWRMFSAMMVVIGIVGLKLTS